MPTTGSSRSGLLAALLLLGALTTNAQAQVLSAPSEEDMALEEFLRTAEIVLNEPVGDGITEPDKLTLESDGVTRRAIFKDVDIEIDQLAHADAGLERNFTDKYAYEVAAYRIDRMLGMGLVPVSVVREVDGVQGSVQLWIEDATTLEKAIEDPNSGFANDEDFNLFGQRMMQMYVLDALIANIDRNYSNILVNLEENVFHPIDHSRAFRLGSKPHEQPEGTGLPLDAEVAAALRSFEITDLKALLDELLEGDQIRFVEKRRDRLLKILEGLNLLPQ